MRSLIDILARDRDIRSLGDAAEVVERMRKSERSYAAVFAGIFSDDPVVRLRAIDSVEKVSREYPTWLHKRQHLLLDHIEQFDGHDVQQMHLALLAEVMKLDGKQAEKLLTTLGRWSQRDHKWIRVSCLSGMAAIAQQQPALASRAREMIEQTLAQDPSPSVQKRGEKVLADLAGGNA